MSGTLEQSKKETVEGTQKSEGMTLGKKFGLRCTIEIKNNFPTNTVITTTLVKFYYNDSGSDYSYDPPNGVPGVVNTPPGQSSFRNSRNDSDCVKRIDVTVNTDNQGGPYTGTFNKRDCADGQCMCYDLLGFKPIGFKHDLKEKDYELTTIDKQTSKSTE